MEPKDITHSQKLLWEKTFMDCLLMPPKDATPPNFVEKTFAQIATNSQKFSPSRVSHYTVGGYCKPYILRMNVTLFVIIPNFIVPYYQ